MHRTTFAAIVIGLTLMTCGAAAQVVVNMPPPPARQDVAESSGAPAANGSTASATVDPGWLALNRYVGAHTRPTITTASWGGSWIRPYQHVWYGPVIGSWGWGWPIIGHPHHHHSGHHGHGHWPKDFFSGSFNYGSSKWNIRLRF